MAAPKTHQLDDVARLEHDLIGPHVELAAAIEDDLGDEG